MKKTLVTIVLCFTILYLLSGCTGAGATGKNVEIEKYGTDDTYVCFYTVCPECGHKSFTGHEVNKGETYESMSVCKNCSYMFEYTIER